jgi:hypothetical protein
MSKILNLCTLIFVILLLSSGMNAQFKAGNCTNVGDDCCKWKGDSFCANYLKCNSSLKCESQGLLFLSDA